jgi:predicted RNA-binding protein with PUA-like domain
MNYWLIKTEPGEYAYDDLVRDNRTVWDGVTNNWALTFIRRMRRGDRMLVYHTGKEKAVSGVAEIIKDPYPDPAADDEKIVVFDIKPVQKLGRPVPLAEIKKDKRFADFELVKISRLSVMPVSAERWKLLLKLGDTPP